MAKIPTAVFQCNFLGKFVYLATAFTAFATTGRVWLASDQLAKRPVALGFRPIELDEFETFLKRVSSTLNNAYFTNHRKSRDKAFHFRVDSAPV